MDIIDKAREIGNECGKQYDDGYYHIVADSREDCFNAALKMAKWKDENFKNIVNDYIELAYSSGQAANLLEDLLKEL